MHETLKDLWYGNLSPHERYVKSDSEYKHLMELKDDLIDRLLASLTEEGRECFEKIEDLNKEMLAISEEDTFITGFQLGARLMLDALSEYNGQFHI